MTSPIEALIDKACGVSKGIDPTTFVTLHCLLCDKIKQVYRDKTDPKGTARIEICCELCNQGDFQIIDYFDSEGNQILA